MIRGQYEQPLISFVEDYFQRQGFRTYAHAQLNIAWAKLISDIDVLAVKPGQVIAIEVKSKKDNFEKAFQQLKDIQPFVDRTFIATDDEVKANRFRTNDSDIGIIYLDLPYDEILIKKKAKQVNQIPSMRQFCYLRRCCLEQLAKEFKIPPHQSKQYIALDLTKVKAVSKLRRRIKDIALMQDSTHRH